MTTGLKPPSNYYLELIVNFPPRPIANEAEYQATQAQINKILERSNLTEDDRAYLKILGLTIYDYEEKHEQLPMGASHICKSIYCKVGAMIWINIQSGQII